LKQPVGVMLEAMSSMELTMWQCYFVEHNRRQEDHAARRDEERRLLGEDA
jgi:hypothetical protein